MMKFKIRDCQRLPITAKTHEPTCTRGCASDASEGNKKLWIIAQKAGKQTTGHPEVFF